MEALKDLPELITPNMLADLTGKKSSRVIRRQCAEGVIPAVRIGRNWYMSRDAVLGKVLKGGEGCQ